MPKIRQDAVEMVRRGTSARKVGRYFGYHHTAIMRWVHLASRIGNHPIPTQSSRPKSHPKTLSRNIVNKIIEKRLECGRYAEAIHKELHNDVKKINCALKKYLRYYNYDRVHGGINYLTPMQVV